MGKKMREGRRLKSLHPMDKVSPYIMVERNDATNYFSSTFDMDEAERYIHQKRAEGMKGFGTLHLMLAAYVRVISQYPGMNRFVRGQKVYARNRIVVCMDVKKSMALNEEATVVKVEFAPTDTAADVYNKFMDAYNTSMQDADNDFDSTAKLIDRIPGLIKKFVVWVLKGLDYFGLLPKALVEVSPFHGSMFITALGSLGIPPIFHHLYRFGNVPIFIAFGAKRHAYELDKDGKAIPKTFMDFTISCDERIADGHYYATAFKALRRLLRHPAALDTPPESVVEDIE